jgi:hypothetical protein
VSVDAASRRGARRGGEKAPFYVWSATHALHRAEFYYKNSVDGALLASRVPARRGAGCSASGVLSRQGGSLERQDGRSAGGDEADGAGGVYAVGGVCTRSAARRGLMRRHGFCVEGDAAASPRASTAVLRAS